ncbi:MAG: hypothetical protein WCJ15_08430 [Alphaproteobacteria bacterium]
MTFWRLGAMLFLSFVAAAQADTLTLRIKSDDGQIQFFKGRKKLSDSQLNQLCAAAKARKDEIEFQREKMTANDALASILKEAQCLGATRSGTIQREPEPKSAVRKHAKPRHRAKARR